MPSQNMLFEVSPILPNGNLITLRMSAEGATSKGVLVDDEQWIPIITQRPAFNIELTSSGLLSEASIRYDAISFNVSEIFDNEVWSTYDWTGALGRIWVGEDGAPFSEYTQIFEGSVSALSRDDDTATVQLLGTEADLNQSLLYDDYEGVGNAEGPATLKGKLKPWASGICLNVDPVLVDSAYWIYQVHGYGAIEDIPAVYEFAQKLANPVASVTTWAQLTALDLEPGQWAKCLPLGLFRLGGQPSQKVSCDVHGAKDGSTFPTSVSGILAHLIKVASPAASIGDLSIFDDVDWCFYSTQQANLGDIARQAVFEAGGYVLPDGTGTWQVGDFFNPKTPITLSSKRDAEPLVLSVTELPTGGPVYKVRVGYDRCWSTHTDAEISPAILEIEQNADAIAQDAADALAAAQAAAADTDLAVQRLNAMSADGQLDRAEKKYWVGEYARLASEKNQLLAEAAGFPNVTTPVNALTSSFSALDAYLATLTPAWNDATQDTPVTRSSFVDAWKAVYVARQTLQSAMAEEAAKRAQWDLVDDPNGTKPEDNATEGGTIGENIKDDEGNVIPREDIITEEGTAKDVQFIGTIPTETFKATVAQAEADIEDLIATYGDTASASASALAAQEAKDDALAAASAADGHASVASTKRDEAVGAMTAAAASALTASVKAAKQGLTENAQFTEGVNGWFNGYTTVGSTPTALIGATNWNGAAAVALNNANTRRDMRGSVADIDPSRSYRLRFRYWATNTCIIYFGVCRFTSAGGTGSSKHLIQVGDSQLNQWVEGSILIDPADLIGFVQLTPYTLTNTGSVTSTVGIDYLYIEDVTESEEAGTHAAVAEAAAVSASDSEASAATSQALTAQFVSDVATSLSDFFPKTLNPDLISWNASSGSTSSTTPITSSNPSWVAPDRTYIEVPTGQSQLAFRGTVPVTDGDVFRLTADAEQILSAGAYSSVHWYCRMLDANFNLLASATAVGSYINLAQGQRGVISYDVGYNAPGLCDYNLTTGGTKYLRFALLVNRMESSVTTQPGSVTRVHAMYLEDIKSEANATKQADVATTQAGISTSQATTATNAAASATTQSNLAATYSTSSRNEVINQLPSTFENDGTYFRNGYDGSPSSAPPFSIGNLGGSFQTVAGVGRVIQVTSTSGTRDVAPIGALPVIPGRKYRITARCRTLANTRSISLYFIGLDDNYAYAGSRTSAYAFTATTTWQTFTYDVDPAALIPNGLVYVRPLWRGNAGAETLQLHSIKIEDITEAMDAAASATISTNQAAVATAQAAAAQQSMALTASLMGNYLTQNGGFDNYPSNATGALPYAWSGIGTNLSYRVADPQGGFAWRGISVAGSDCYINTATQHVVKQNDYVVYEGEIILNSGSLTGSGMLVYGLNSSGSVLESNYIQFAVEKDSTNTVVGAGVAGRSYKFSKMFRLSNANTVGIQIYAMNHWTSLGSVAAANDITWRRCGVRVANAQEIAAGVALPALEATVSSQASVLSTHTTQLASRLESVSAGPSSATLKMTALNSSGGAASQIALQADEIKLGTTGGGLTINGGKATFTGELNVGNDTGQRVKITSNLIEVYNASGVRLIRLGIW